MFVDYHLDKYFNTSNQKCQFSQGIIPFGGPLEGYKNTGDERMEQQTSKFLRPGLVVSGRLSRGGTCAWVADNRATL